MKVSSCLESSWDNRNQTGGAGVLSGWPESPPGLPGSMAPAWRGTPCSLCLFVFLKLSDLEELMKRENQKILTPLVSLDTPGKATVQVIILADPVSITQEGDRLPHSFLLMCLSAKFVFSWCRTDMKFALWGMKHFENSQRWIQRETNYWMTWVSFLNSYPLWPKGIMCMEMGQFLLSEPCPFAVGVTWARDLCQLHDYLCDSWRGAACVPSLPFGYLEETPAAKYITVLLRDQKCPITIHSHYLSPLVISSPFYSIILFLPGELFSPAYKLNSSILKNSFYSPRIHSPGSF